MTRAILINLLSILIVISSSAMSDKEMRKYHKQRDKRAEEILQKYNRARSNGEWQEMNESYNQIKELRKEYTLAEQWKFSSLNNWHSEYLMHSIFKACAANATLQRSHQAKLALTEYKKAIKENNHAKAIDAIESIKQLRQEYPLCENDSILDVWEDRYKKELFSDYYLITEIAFNKGDQKIVDEVQIRLGYSQYLEARQALKDLDNAIEELDAQKVTQAIDRIRKNRNSLSFAQRNLPSIYSGFLAIFSRYSWHPDPWEQTHIYTKNTEQIVKKLADVLIQNNDIKKCKETIEALQSEYDVKKLAIDYSNFTPDNYFLASYTRKAALLAALYELNVPLNNQRLLEQAQKAIKKYKKERNSEEYIATEAAALETIYKYNPNLQNKI